MWQRATWHECATELDGVCLRFRRAYWGGRTNRYGWPRHPDDQREMVETSIKGVEILRALALAVRSEQDFGRVPHDQSVVGAFKKANAVPNDATETKQHRGYKYMLGVEGYSPLTLRQALNKIAHADPQNADFYVGSRETAHDLLLFGDDHNRRWFAAISILALIRVIHGLPDAKIETQSV